MKAENLYHTGMVVDDLDATMVWFTEVASYTWTDVVTVDRQAVTPDGEITIPVKMVYSGADPRLELLQTVAGTVWTPADSGVHHIGYWSDDVESDLATLESNGLTYEVKSYNPDGSGTLLCAYAKGPTGPRKVWMCTWDYPRVARALRSARRFVLDGPSLKGAHEDDAEPKRRFSPRPAPLWSLAPKARGDAEDVANHPVAQSIWRATHA